MGDDDHTHVPQAGDYGDLERRDGDALVRFTRQLTSPPQRVWRALAEPEHLAAWFPTTIEGERATGSPLHFAFRDLEAPPFEGEMLSFEPPWLMELRWGGEILRFELAAEGDGSVLTFTARFGEFGKGARDGAGWHSCLDLLGWAVADRPAPWSAADRWHQVHHTYRDRFGPEASTVGPPEEWERVHGAETRHAT
jgi:uncharacterized protein YndB with AHSA1/START domain